MKKAIIVIALMLSFCAYVHAQKMTDEQVIEYVMEARQKGQSDGDIVKGLLRKGVTMDQVNRIQRQSSRQARTGQRAHRKDTHPHGC